MSSRRQENRPLVSRYREVFLMKKKIILIVCVVLFVAALVPGFFLLRDWINFIEPHEDWHRIDIPEYGYFRVPFEDWEPVENDGVFTVVDGSGTIVLSQKGPADDEQYELLRSACSSTSAIVAKYKFSNKEEENTVICFSFGQYVPDDNYTNFELYCYTDDIDYDLAQEIIKTYSMYIE